SLPHTREGHARKQPVALPTPLTVPNLTGQDARKSVVDFLDHLSSFKTACDLSVVDVLQQFLPVTLRGAAEALAALPAPFRLWDTFVAALREEFLPVDNEYRLRCDFDARTQHPDQSLSAYVREMQELFRRADPRAPRNREASASSLTTSTWCQKNKCYQWTSASSHHPIEGRRKQESDGELLPTRILLELKQSDLLTSKAMASFVIQPLDAFNFSSPNEWSK
ncbi:hypothetical protein MTO96_040192, partial [Rhipicephalus appendiculatus]